MESNPCYRINEIFYSLQGEGRWAGTPAVFVRFSGCNLTCDFCDTEHLSHEFYAEAELVREIAKYPTRHVVLTGGEPTLQIRRSLIDNIHALGKFVQIETNGTKRLGEELECAIDWITLSPKYESVAIQRFDELKIVYQEQDMAQYETLSPGNDACRYLQPCDTKDEAKNADNINKTIEFIKANPQWKLSLQTQKILNVR